MKAKQYMWVCIGELIIFVLFGSSLLSGQTPIVSFLAANGGSISEGVGGVITSVTIENPNANETTVEIIKMGTAIYGEDYTTNPDTIIFPAGSSSPQTLHIVLIDDCLDESNETMIFMLINPSNGAQIGIGTMTTTLADDDTQPIEDCTYTVPSNIGVVTNTFSYLNHNGKFWVCETGILRLKSNNNLALVESGGVVRAERDNNTIYVKSGGTALVQGGDQNVIYAEDGAIVTVESGVCNSIFASSGAIYTDNGSGTTTSDLSCAPLDIDYTSAPMSGCLISSTNSVNPVNNFEIFPNPSSGNFEIYYSNDQIPKRLEVYDNRGVFLRTISAEERKFALIPGIYLVRCIFRDEALLKRLVIIND